MAYIRKLGEIRIAQKAESVPPKNLKSDNLFQFKAWDGTCT